MYILKTFGAKSKLYFWNEDEPHSIMISIIYPCQHFIIYSFNTLKNLENLTGFDEKGKSSFFRNGKIWYRKRSGTERKTEIPTHSKHSNDILSYF